MLVQVIPQPPIFIRNIEEYTTKEEVATTITEMGFGLIDHISILYVSTPTETIGYCAFIHFEAWNTSSTAIKYKKIVMEGGTITIIPHELEFGEKPWEVSKYKWSNNKKIKSIINNTTHENLQNQENTTINDENKLANIIKNRTINKIKKRRTHKI